MQKEQLEQGALSVGQVAKRWGIGAERVRQLIEVGELPEAFTIPSAGRYGETVKIPYSAVVDAERRWRILPTTNQPTPVQRFRHRTMLNELRHFPELNLEPDVGCCEDAPRPGGDTAGASE